MSLLTRGCSDRGLMLGGHVEGLVLAAETLIQLMASILRGQRFTLAVLRILESLPAIKTHPENKREAFSTV